MYDIIIIGAGPAGMTASIYGARRALKVLVIAKEIGGQMAKTFLIENYPGLKQIDGVSLAFDTKAQAESIGVEFVSESVEKIEKDSSDIFNIFTKEKQYQAKSVIIASGLEKRKLGIENEEKYDGKGISYCVNCDGPLFKNKIVAVIGGGNAGAEAVEFLSKICPKVFWLEITDSLRADAILVDKIKKLQNVEIHLNSQAVGLSGENILNEITLQKYNEKISEKVDGVFVEIGYKTDTAWLKDLVSLDELGQIKIDENCHTSSDGIFSAGDITNSKYKQIVVAQGMGAIASLEAYNFLRDKK